jgi:hypothetical protein
MGHERRRAWSTRQRPAPERFWEKVNKASGQFWDGTECWQWIGATKPRGYGNFCPHRTRTMQAHRFAYELLVGPIPAGLELDHLCDNPGCVNPAHLEPKTTRANGLRSAGASAVNARKTHCPKGHPYDAANTIRLGSGQRLCRTCNKERGRAKRVNSQPPTGLLVP